MHCETRRSTCIGPSKFATVAKIGLQGILRITARRTNIVNHESLHEDAIVGPSLPTLVLRWIWYDSANVTSSLLIGRNRIKGSVLPVYRFLETSCMRQTGIWHAVCDGLGPPLGYAPSDYFIRVSFAANWWGWWMKMVVYLRNACSLVKVFLFTYIITAARTI